MAPDPPSDASPLFFSRYVEKIVVPVRICDPGGSYGRCLSFCGFDDVHHSLPEIGASRHLCPTTRNGSSELESLSGFAGYRFCCGRERLERWSLGSPFAVPQSAVISSAFQLLQVLDFCAYFVSRTR